MSRPRVGPHATRKRACLCSSRPSSTRCWLPPESASICWSSPAERTSSSCDEVLAVLGDPPAAQPAVALEVTPALQAEDEVVPDGAAPTSPFARRSSGHVRDLAARSGCAGRRSSRRGRAGGSRRRAAERRPVRHSARRPAPLPATPAMPRISPARTVRDTPSRRACGRPRPRESRTASTSSPVASTCATRRSGSDAADHQRAELPGEVPAVGMRAHTCPSRRTVTRCGPPSPRRACG